MTMVSVRDLNAYNDQIVTLHCLSDRLSGLCNIKLKWKLNMYKLIIIMYKYF